MRSEGDEHPGKVTVTATIARSLPPAATGLTQAAPARPAARAVWGSGRRSLLLALLAFGPAFTGCQKTYYTVLEKFGVEKRELLATRVERAKESQQEAQEEFRDALEEFQAVTGHSGGELEERYERLRDAYTSSSEQAKEVSERIDKVESVAEALFDEWEDELDQYDDPALRRRSEEQLRDTRTNV
ncbi:MAG TPA: DUF2959 family protein, partial [Polyangiaceae bacterium]|nr:DUF2959 family protein [Polyangiaceae bacterium]